MILTAEVGGSTPIAPSLALLEIDSNAGHFRALIHDARRARQHHHEIARAEDLRPTLLVLREAERVEKASWRLARDGRARGEVEREAILSRVDDQETAP